MRSGGFYQPAQGDDHQKGYIATPACVERLVYLRSSPRYVINPAQLCLKSARPELVEEFAGFDKLGSNGVNFQRAGPIASKTNDRNYPPRRIWVY